MRPVWLICWPLAALLPAVFACFRSAPAAASVSNPGTNEERVVPVVRAAPSTPELQTIEIPPFPTPGPRRVTVPPRLSSRTTRQPILVRTVTVPTLPRRLTTVAPIWPRRTTDRREDRLYPRDCADVQRFGLGLSSGVYEIFRPGCLSPASCAKSVTCDLQTDGGGWTIIQQRIDGSTDFHRNWMSYRNGFGDARNFWIGNEYLYELTNMFNRSYQLLIQLSDFESQSIFSLYSLFKLKSEHGNYALTLGSMFGSSATDNLVESRGAEFGTYDTRGSDSCAARQRSGWWFGTSCQTVGNLNVPYEHSGELQGLRWLTDRAVVRIRTSQMKIRPVDFRARLTS